MLTKNLKLSIKAEHETVWNLLMSRLKNPQAYMTGITEVKIINDDGKVMVRELLQHGHRVREKITISPYDSEICHEILEHPTFSGQITSKIISTARQSPVAQQHLEYHIELIPKSQVVEGVVKGEEETVAELEAEMHAIKSRAEEMEHPHS